MINVYIKSIVSKHVSVSLLFVKKRRVSWSFVCQFKIDMFFTPWHDDTEQSNFITTRLDRMKALGVKLLDWVTCFPFHFTLAYIVY